MTGRSRAPNKELKNSPLLLFKGSNVRRSCRVNAKQPHAAPMQRFSPLDRDLPEIFIGRQAHETFRFRPIEELKISWPTVCSGGSRPQELALDWSRIRLVFVGQAACVCQAGGNIVTQEPRIAD